MHAPRPRRHVNCPGHKGRAEHTDVVLDVVLELQLVMRVQSRIDIARTTRRLFDNTGHHYRALNKCAQKNVALLLRGKKESLAESTGCLAKYE